MEAAWGATSEATGETWVDAEAVRGDAEVVTEGENSVDDLGEGARAAIWLAAAAGTQGPTLLEGHR